MSKTLYLECNGGISGDMTVGALLDLGADRQVLERVLTTLPVQGFQIQISRVKKQGIEACDFNVMLDQEHENHDHDMEYLYGKTAQEAEQSSGEQSHHHVHQDPHDHHEDHHDHHDHQDHQDHNEDHLDHHDPHDHHHGEVRNLIDILDIIEKAQMTDRARDLAARIFRILAEGEAKVHGTTPEQVHFHEVGAVDSIVDILATAVCLDNLDIAEVIVPVLCEGTGYVRCQHGRMPIPVPAVAAIASAHALPLQITDTFGELVTPTGAAIVAAIQTGRTLPAQMVIERVGMGAGKRTHDRPSLLRAMLIREEQKESEETLYKLETNVDDCSGEILGYTMNLLLDAGARDVYYVPIYMKKNRPAYELNVLCAEEEIPTLERLIFRETTTIGIRRIPVKRSTLKRQIIKVHTAAGEVRVKCCTEGGETFYYPEYDSVVAVAQTSGLSFAKVYQMAQRQADRREQ